MTAAEISQLLGGFILGFASLPQIIRLLITKNSEGISVLTYLMIVIGNICMLVYALELYNNGIGKVLLITTIIGLTMVTTTLGLILYYKRRRDN